MARKRRTVTFTELPRRFIKLGSLRWIKEELSAMSAELARTNGAELLFLVILSPTINQNG